MCSTCGKEMLLDLEALHDLHRIIALRLQLACRLHKASLNLLLEAHYPLCCAALCATSLSSLCGTSTS
jgi:hypothetical protein